MSLRFLNLEEFTKDLKPVSSSQIRSRTNDFHTLGLFSESIFGVIGSLDRKKIFSYIDLNCYVIHPTAYKILIQLDRKIERFLSTESFFNIDKNGSLIESEIGITGITEFIKNFSNIKFRGDTPDREKYILLMNNSYQNKTLFINRIPVIPPDQREIGVDQDGRDILPPINDIYISLIRKCSVMKAIGSKGVSYDLFNWGIQKEVINHDTFIRTKIGKKYGLVRSQLLGKRVEQSGRAVITSGPQFKPNEIGLPFRLAVSLFEPFIIHVVLYSGKIDKNTLSKEVLKFTKLDLSTSSLSVVFRSIKNDDIVP